MVWVQLFFLGTMLAVLLGLLAVRRQGKQRRFVAWASAAERMDLDLHVEQGLAAAPALRGTLEGHAVLVRDRAATERLPRTTFEVLFAAPEIDLELRKIGVLESFSRDGAAFRTGDEAFDRCFASSARTKAELTAFLTPARRAALVDAASSLTLVGEGGIEAQVARRLTDAHELELRLRDLVELARALEAEPAPAIQDTNAPPPAAVEATAGAPEPPAPTAAAVAGAAADSLAAPDRAAPDRAAPDSAAPDSAAPDSAAPDSAAVHEACTPDRVALALFAAERTSFDARAEFEREYRGHRVRWTGILAHVDHYQGDAMLGAGPIARTELELLALDPCASVPRAVRAVVALPLQDLEALRELVGEPLRVEGTLVACDPFLRALTLADARLA